MLYILGLEFRLKKEILVNLIALSQVLFFFFFLLGREIRNPTNRKKLITETYRNLIGIIRTTSKVWLHKKYVVAFCI